MWELYVWAFEEVQNAVVLWRLRGESMDRLISEKAVLETIATWVKSSEPYDRNGWLIPRYLYDRVKAIPSAEPYKGMTNGEVIKAMFPHEDVYKGEFGYDLGGCTIDFDWWNSPYEPQERSDKE